MLQNASSLAIVAVDTEENEPIKNEVWWVRRHFLGPRSRRGGEQADPAHARQPERQCDVRQIERTTLFPIRHGKVSTNAPLMAHSYF